MPGRRLITRLTDEILLKKYMLHTRHPPIRAGEREDTCNIKKISK